MGEEFSTSVQTDRGAHPACCTMVIASFPGIKRPGSGPDHPSSSSAEVEKEWNHTSTSHLGLHDVFWGEVYPSLLALHICTTTSFVQKDGRISCDGSVFLQIFESISCKFVLLNFRVVTKFIDILNLHNDDFRLLLLI